MLDGCQKERAVRQVRKARSENEVGALGGDRGLAVPRMRGHTQRCAG